MLKKEQVYVKLESREQAELYRGILEKLGENIAEDFFTGFIPQQNFNSKLTLRELDKKWILGGVMSKSSATFGQLIDLLTEPKKIAVKVDNEWQFNKLMEYYDSKGWKWKTGIMPSEYTTEMPCNVGFEDSFTHSQTYHITEGYTIIQFHDFAKQYGISLTETIYLDEATVTINRKIATAIIEQDGKTFRLDFDSVRKIAEGCK